VDARDQTEAGEVKGGAAAAAAKVQKNTPPSAPVSGETLTFSSLTG